MRSHTDAVNGLALPEEETTDRPADRLVAFAGSVFKRIFFGWRKHNRAVSAILRLHDVVVVFINRMAFT
jgi:hypothetical protein